ncbi:putative membrane protein [Desulfosporosinus orientis DSM 765]|uniref:Putative membrane protein n=1 Tax=Desulfosporosinus orientis (strain ATCC 19365 / DSM 765 / NCIMB 8382 / VKM B-1628 / Singapore I) TaxID=768706 RepID=G7W5S9_DESOD|nr:DUF1294 domain-containing protein [Desulfosporosinus orientis]AET67017.1 putative membrane protein [Desulfosporosinus orientis DSM 765]
MNWWFLWGAYFLWNSYVFVAMWRDKRRAKLHRWRIPETRLLIMGAAFGGVGLYAGMKCFRHKTAHLKFVIGAPLLIVVNLAMIGFFYYFTI